VTVCGKCVNLEPVLFKRIVNSIDDDDDGDNRSDKSGISW